VQVVASQDWPEVTKYAGLVCAQAHRQELIQDLYKEWKDPAKGTMTGGMIKYVIILISSLLDFLLCLVSSIVVTCWPLVNYAFGSFYRELLISFRRATGEKPLRIIFYRWDPFNIS